MNDARDPYYENIGDALKRHRQAAGFDQTSFGKRAGWTQGTVSKFENAQLRVTDEVLNQYLFVLEIDTEEEARLRASQRAAEEALSSKRVRNPAWFQAFREDEHLVSSMRSWNEERIPGLLQSEHYMHALFEGAKSSDVDANLSHRRKRKQALSREPSADFWFLLSESCFWRVPGRAGTVSSGERSEHVLRDQIEYLCKLTRTHPWVHVQVVPFLSALPAMPGDFTIMNFPDRAADAADAEEDEALLDKVAWKKDYVYVENSVKGTYVADASSMKISLEWWEVLTDSALSEHDTSVFLDRFIERRRRFLAAP